MTQQLDIPEMLESQAVASQPVARVRGEPLMQMPTDLYIPPDALEVILEHFEGPLDLLLYLIRKTNVDVLDIPMAALTLQYLEYVEAMRSKNLELAAEYLVMAAMLKMASSAGTPTASRAPAITGASATTLAVAEAKA